MERRIFSYLNRHMFSRTFFKVSFDAIFATSPTASLDSLLMPELKPPKIKGKDLFTLLTGF